MVEVKSDSPLMSIGELASATGVTTSALRYYERRGLVEPVTRESGRRRYDSDARRRVVFVTTAQAAGFSLREIRQLLDSYNADQPPPTAWRALAEQKLAELDRTIREARHTRRILVHAMSCECNTLGECRLGAGDGGVSGQGSRGGSHSAGRALRAG